MIIPVGFFKKRDSLVLPTLVSYFNKDSIDAAATSEGNDVDTWSDVAGTNHATQTGTLSPELHIDSGNGERQVTFDITDWLNIGKPSNLDFIGQVDEWSIVVKIGETAGTRGYFISKADSDVNKRQWSLFQETTTELGYHIGVNAYAKTGLSTIAAYDLIILHVNTSDGFLRVNGTQVDTQTANTYTDIVDADINIGGRSNGGWLYDGDLAFIAVYNGELSAGEIAAIETQYI